jgi:catechol 2,3-dioxygenase-like lactoylglutathione lyase family enzyme
VSVPISEVRIATLGVADIDRALAFYDGALGYRCIEQGVVADELAQAWRTPTGVRLRHATIAVDDSGIGRLRLVSAIAGGGRRLWSAANAIAATGFYALNFRVRSVETTLERVVRCGGGAPRAPSRWEVSPEVAVIDSICDDPDGIRLDLFAYTRGAELRGPLLTDVSTLQTVAIQTADIARSVGFYSALGFRVLFDRTLDFPELAELLGVRAPITIHNVNLMKDGSVIPGRVEMFAYLQPRPAAFTPLSDLAHPPNHGIIGASFETLDLERALRALVGLGARPVGRYEGSVPGIGKGRVATVLGPDGEQLELIQRGT